MKQYCRYCAFCFDMCDVFGCSKQPEKQLYMSRKQINRANNCKHFALTDLGDVETGKQYRPQEKTIKRTLKGVELKQITIDEI